MPMTARVLRSLLMLACSLVGFGLFMIGIRVPFLFMLVAFGVAWNHARRVVGSGWSHGTARIASLGVLIRHRMLGHDGLILGTTGIMPRPSLKEGLAGLWSSSNPAEMACYLFLSALGGLRWGGDRMIRISTFTHLATFAPTGRGKGVSVLVPNLLSYRHSCVVTDPKGELYTLTAKHRRQKFGHWTFRLDPFGICGPGSDRLNLLDWIDDKAADFLDQCRDFADMLVIRTGKENDPHWNDSARMVLTAFIAYVCACEDNREKRTLDTVRDLICSRHSYAKAVEIMQMVDSHWGVVQRQGHSLTWFVEKELGSVLTTVQRNTEFLDSPVIMKNTCASSFNPRWLRTGNVTIYLCLPHDKLETMAPLMRAWLGVILRTITKGTPTERNPVVFFLDEAAHLGKIRVLEQAVTLMRGMGVRLWFFFQSLHQLNDCFGEKAKTILDNIDTQQYFDINDYENSEAISKRIGDATISIMSHGGNSGRTRQTGGTGQESGSVSTGENINYSDTGRRLFKPEELLQLPDDVALIFHKNLPVITARLLRWYSHPAFRNGGTGGQAGLGRTATEKAVALLLVSILFAVFAFTATAPRNELSRFRSEPEWWESNQNPAVSRPQPSYSPSRSGRRVSR